MRETKLRRRLTIARNEEPESVQAWVIWDERQNQEERHTIERNVFVRGRENWVRGG